MVEVDVHRTAINKRAHLYQSTAMGILSLQNAELRGKRGVRTQAINVAGLGCSC